MGEIYLTGRSGTIGKHFPADYKSLYLDLASNFQVDLNDVFQESDLLIHSAGIVGTEAVEKDKELSFRVNVTGTLKLAELFIAHSKNKFVYLSTSHIYKKRDKSIDELSEVSPNSEYAAQKYEAEKRLQALFSDSPDRLLVVRIFSVLDWDMKSWTLGGAARKIARRESGFRLRNCLDVRDFLTPSTIAHLVSQLAHLKGGVGTVNICSGIPTTVGDAVQQMLRGKQFPIEHETFEYGNSINPYMVGNPTKLKTLIPGAELTWSPNKDIVSNSSTGKKE